MATLKSLKNKYLTASDGTILGVTTNTENVSLLAFKVATADSLSKFNLVDGASDDYQDATGIDTGNSSGEIRSSNNYFSGAVAGNYFGDGSLGDCVFGSSSITQTNDTVAIDTKLSTGSESGGPGTNSYGYGAQGCYYPNNPPCPDTVYYTPNSTATYEITVPNTNGSYDGDMTYAQFNTLTINSGVTLTTKQPGRGLFIYVKGNCVINGSLCMTARGGASNPTVSGGSDSNAVSASGIQLGMVKSGGTDTFTNDGTGFNGAGTGIRSIVANQMDIASNGTIFTIARVGANGGGNRSGSTAQSGQSGTAGTSAVTILTGGGGGGRRRGDGDSLRHGDPVHGAQIRQPVIRRAQEPEGRMGGERGCGGLPCRRLPHAAVYSALGFRRPPVGARVRIQEPAIPAALHPRAAHLGRADLSEAWIAGAVKCDSSARLIGPEVKSSPAPRSGILAVEDLDIRRET